MRFKLYYNEGSRKFDIHCLPDKHQEIVMPENPSQHIYYPIPNEMKDEIHKDLVNLIPEDAVAELNEIDEAMKELVQHRQQRLHELRKEINPKIFEAIENFRIERAELFI